MRGAIFVAVSFDHIGAHILHGHARILFGRRTTAAGAPVPFDQGGGEGAGAILTLIAERCFKRVRCHVRSHAGLRIVVKTGPVGLASPVYGISLGRGGERKQQ